MSDLFTHELHNSERRCPTPCLKYHYRCDDCAADCTVGQPRGPCHKTDGKFRCHPCNGAYEAAEAAKPQKHRAALEKISSVLGAPGSDASKLGLIREHVRDALGPEPRLTWSAGNRYEQAVQGVSATYGGGACVVRGPTGIWVCDEGGWRSVQEGMEKQAPLPLVADGVAVNDGALAELFGRVRAVSPIVWHAEYMDDAAYFGSRAAGENLVKLARQNLLLEDDEAELLGFQFPEKR